MRSGEYRPRYNNYQPLRDQEQKTARETAEQTTAEKNATRETTGQGAAENRDNEPQRNDRSLERSPGADGADMVTINTYGNWQVRVSHAQRMEREASEGASQERTPARERIEQDAGARQGTSQDRTPALERVEQSASEQNAVEPAIDPSRSTEIER
jgi:hypothetical protein